MEKEYLEKLGYLELKEMASEMDIKISKSKKELIEKIIKCFQLYKKYKKENNEKYKKIKQIGNEGKEGITYLVENKDGKKYAMKTFKKTKSSEKIKKEAELQKMASDYKIAPKVIEVDSVSKFIVMEKLDKHLFDILKENNGILKIEDQKNLIHIFKKLDECEVFHADANILNYMYKNKKLFIIDFGMSKKIDDKLIKKLKTENPNLELMNLGFILKLKELSCPKSSYSYLIKYVSNDNISKFNL